MTLFFDSLFCSHELTNMPAVFKDEIRFRCESDLKPRLKRAVKNKYGRLVKYQAATRDIVRAFVESEEKAKVAA